MTACAGTRGYVVDDGAELDATAVLAKGAVSFAASRAAGLSRDTVNRVVDGRVASANGLVEAVVATVRATRAAVPTTREPRATEAARARELLSIALEHVGSRRAETVWGSVPLTTMLDDASALLAELSTLLSHCEAGRSAEADTSYDRVFVLYDRFRASTSEVAELGSSDPIGLWARSPVVRIQVDARTASR